MKTNTNSYRGHRFPREIISHGVWLYHRFSLSFRDVEELLAKRGIIVSYEAIRQWCRRYCQLKLILACLDVSPRKQTPEYRAFLSYGSLVLP